MKILMINTASSTILNFRKDLIKALINKGHSIVLITGDGEFKDEISQLNVMQYVISMNNRSKNPFANYQYVRKVRTIAKQENPDIVFAFQAKPNTLGIMAVRKYCDHIYAMIEGIGDVFIKQNLQWVIIRIIMKIMYNKSLKHTKKVFF